MTGATNDIYDLIYLDTQEEYNELSELFRAAGYTVKDASDFVHTYRFSAEKEIIDTDHILFILRNRLLGISLAGELMQMQYPHVFHALAEQVIAEFKIQDLLNEQANAFAKEV